jgi:hypothetical protein
MQHSIEIEGLSQFFYFAIPAVLGLAAIYWLAFGEGLHYFRRVLSQEKRHAEIVGARILPREPMKITIHHQLGESLTVDRAEIDGGDLWVYYKNTGASGVRGIQLTWRIVAPDGTVIKAGDRQYVSVYSKNDAPDELDAGERGEAHFKIPSDPRAVTLDLRMSHY